MSRCIWVDYVYKLLLTLVGAAIVTPGMGDNFPKTVVHWTRTNERFNVEGAPELTVTVGSNLHIICPFRTTPLEYYYVYWVNEIGFKQCFRPNNASKLLVKCDQPTVIEQTWIQEIKGFTATPGGMDFTVGMQYYIATFSTGSLSGINNTIAGACADDNMRLNISIGKQLPVTTSGPSNATTTTPTTNTTYLSTSTATMPTTPPVTTIPWTTPNPYTTDIPDFTDIPVITVPDNPNTGVIDISSAHTLRASSPALVLSLCLSLLHILYRNIPHIQR